MLDKLRKNKDGFTIIEVLIVLAIAGLILLIVLIAIPALQRNQRNTGRKADAGHVVSAINNFVSNNNNTLPGQTGGATYTGWNADCGTIVNDAGALAQYSKTNGLVCTNPLAAPAASVGTVLKFDVVIATDAAAFPLKSATTIGGQAMVLAEGYQCGSFQGDTLSPSATAAQAQQTALYYTSETNGGWIWNCINGQ